MRCLYCNIALTSSSLDDEFCCDDHRQAFEAESASAIQHTEHETQPVSGVLERLRLRFAKRAPELSAETSDAELGTNTITDDEQASEAPAHPARETAASWRWLTAAWKSAPRDLKLVSLLLPVLLVVAITGSIPKVPIKDLAAPNLDRVQSQVEKLVGEQWKTMNQTISE